MFTQWGGRNRGAGWEHIFPFGIKVYQCGDVWLPRLNLKVVELLIRGAGIIIFICKAGKTVSELVYKYLQCPRAVAGAQAIEVVYAATAIFFIVYNYI